MKTLLKIVMLFQIIKRMLAKEEPKKNETQKIKSKVNNFTEFMINEQGYKETMHFKKNGVVCLILPGSIFQKNDLEDINQGRIQVLVNNTNQVIFPGHNSFLVNGSSVEIELKIEKTSVYKGRKGFVTFTDETNVTYPYYPGYDWVTFSLKEKRTYIRVLPDIFMNEKYIMTYGILNNTATHISMFGQFNMSKHRFQLMEPMIKNFDLMYMELDTNYPRMTKGKKFDKSMEDFYLNTLSSASPQGNILISQKKTKAFDLKMMIRLFKGNVNYTTIKGTMDVGLNWTMIDDKNVKFEGKKITLNNLKYHHGLYHDDNSELTNYVHFMVNTTFGLSQLSKTREKSIHRGVSLKTPVVYKKLRLNKQYFASVMATVEVEGIQTLLDYSVTEVLVKGSNPSRMFPYIYFIVLVLVTMGIVIFMYSILKHLKDHPEYVEPAFDFDVDAYKKGGYLETSKDAGNPSMVREGQMHVEYQNGNVNPGDVLMSEARQEVSPHKIPDDPEEDDVRNELSKTEKELASAKKALEKMDGNEAV